MPWSLVWGSSTAVMRWTDCYMFQQGEIKEQVAQFSPDIRKNIGLFEGSQGLPTCPPEHSSIRRSLGHWYNDSDRGKHKSCKTNLSQCHFVQHKSHVYWPGIIEEPLRWETGEWPPLKCKFPLRNPQKFLPTSQRTHSMCLRKNNSSLFAPIISLYFENHPGHTKTLWVKYKVYECCTLRAADQKYLESFEMWCWRRMEKISWTDHVRNEEVLLRVNEQRNILHEIRKRKADWIRHILRRNCLLNQVIEGKIKGEVEVTRRRGRRRRKLLDELKKRRGYSHLKEEALERTMWRYHFGGGFEPVVRQNTEW